MTFERVIMFFLLWLTCFAILPMQLSSSPTLFQPEGPDAFMRLERVNTLVESGDWYEGHIARAAGEGGADIHWTRPMDILILGTAAPLMPFMEIPQAIEMAGVILPLVMSLLLVMVCIWAVIPLMQPGNLFAIVILLAVQPIIQNYFHLGRADHHMVLAVLTAAVLGCLIRLRADSSRPRFALFAGLLSGLGLWISLEFLIVFVPVVFGLGICWLFWGAPWRHINRDFSIGALILSLMAIAIDVAPENWLIARYDRISIVQLLLVASPVFYWAFIAGYFDRKDGVGWRLTGTALFGAICLTIIYYYFPNLLIGPVAEADPRIGPVWYDKVSEMLPLLDNPRRTILYCLLPLVGIAYGGFAFFRNQDIAQRQLWARLLPVLVCTGALALFHVRAALYLAVVGVIAAGPLLEYLLTQVNTHYSGWKRSATGLLVRAAIIMGPFLLALLVGTVTSSLKSSEAVAASKPKPAKCDVSEVAAALSDEAFIKGRGMLRFANNLDVGPELVYRTPHHFLAVPYHRNGETIFDTHALLTATDFSRSKEILYKYEIDYILICPDASKKNYFEDSDSPKVLYNRLAAGNLPDGLMEVDAPSPWRLFAVRKGAE